VRDQALADEAARLAVIQEQLAAHQEQLQLQLQQQPGRSPQMGSPEAGLRQLAGREAQLLAQQQAMVMRERQLAQAGGRINPRLKDTE